MGIDTNKKKVISFSLWGDNTRYTFGAIQNASLGLVVYPDWICRFHVGKSTPSYITDHLREYENTEVIEREEDGDWTGMFWRFHDASDPDVEVMLSRDCDSRLWFREKAAVDEWLSGDKSFHIMRDHPAHGVPILGGMWGVRNQKLSNMKDLCNSYGQENKWQTDQNFLRDVVWPLVHDDSHINDLFFDKTGFPGGEWDEGHFVGQSYKGTGKRFMDGEQHFQEYMRKTIL
tara:strand:- start:704 stop:1396 length:693 start_codon:yes stop_codon:yes gene_type:complete